MNIYANRIINAINYNEQNNTPIAFYGGAPFSTSLLGVSMSEYFRNIEVKINTFKKLFKLFPEVVFFPGFWPDFGTVFIVSGFGAKVTWPRNGTPHAYPILNCIDEVDKLRMPNPFQDGLMKNVLSEWEYMWSNLDKKWIDEYGYLDGVAHSLGPIETAAQLRGYSEICLDIYEKPIKVHQLLQIATEAIIKYLKEEEKINGKIKRLIVADHFPSLISLSHCQEFFSPYIKMIFNEFAYAEIKMWHNEGKCNHILQEIPKFGCNLWHFGSSENINAKKILQNKVALMGNVDPLTILLKGDIKNVEGATVDALNMFSPGGGYILSSGGGMAPGTKLENVIAMIQAANMHHH